MWNGTWPSSVPFHIGDALVAGELLDALTDLPVRGTQLRQLTLEIYRLFFRTTRVDDLTDEKHRQTRTRRQQ